MGKLWIHCIRYTWLGWSSIEPPGAPTWWSEGPIHPELKILRILKPNERLRAPWNKKLITFRTKCQQNVHIFKCSWRFLRIHKIHHDSPSLTTSPLRSRRKLEQVLNPSRGQEVAWQRDILLNYGSGSKIEALGHQRCLGFIEIYGTSSVLVLIIQFLSRHPWICCFVLLWYFN
jgi:hypothetical protein